MIKKKESTLNFSFFNEDVSKETYNEFMRFKWITDNSSCEIQGWARATPSVLTRHFWINITVNWGGDNFVLNYVELIGQVGRVFANCPGDRGSIPGRVKPKT